MPMVDSKITRGMISSIYRTITRSTPRTSEIRTRRVSSFRKSSLLTRASDIRFPDESTSAAAAVENNRGCCQRCKDVHSVEQECSDDDASVQQALEAVPFVAEDMLGTSNDCTAREMPTPRRSIADLEDPTIVLHSVVKMTK